MFDGRQVRSCFGTFLVSFLGLTTLNLAEPLRIHPLNPRYFTDENTNSHRSLRAIYLTGTHTWPNLIDRSPSNPPAPFQFDAYLELLQRHHHHNFIRLWARHVTWYHGYGEGELHAAPLPWRRAGPGKALDGKPSFDLAQLDESYFQRLRSRCVAARDRGIYVSIMLFGAITNALEDGGEILSITGITPTRSMKTRTVMAKAWRVIR